MFCNLIFKCKNSFAGPSRAWGPKRSFARFALRSPLYTGSYFQSGERCTIDIFHIWKTPLTLVKTEPLVTLDISPMAIYQDQEWEGEEQTLSTSGNVADHHISRCRKASVSYRQPIPDGYTSFLLHNQGLFDVKDTIDASESPIYHNYLTERLHESLPEIIRNDQTTANEIVGILGSPYNKRLMNVSHFRHHVNGLIM